MNWCRNGQQVNNLWDMKNWQTQVFNIVLLGQKTNLKVTKKGLIQNLSQINIVTLRWKPVHVTFQGNQYIKKIPIQSL